MKTEQSPLVFFWLGIRPKMQVIRYLLSLLNINYIEININHLNQQLKKCPQQILSKHNIQQLKLHQRLQNLPLLLHDQFQIYDVYPIFSYICSRFNALELLGRNHQQKAQVQQLIQSFLSQKSILLKSILSLAEFSDKPEKQILVQKQKMFQKIVHDSSCFRYMCQYLERQQKKQNTYVLQSITIIDLLFMETSYMILGICGNIDQKKMCPINHILINIFCKQPEENPMFKYLRTMRKHNQFMKSHDFYKKNEQKLDRLSIVCQKFPQATKKGIKKLWVGNPKSIAD